MKESPHITLTEEQEKRDTIHCAMWASIVVLGMLALFLHGMAFLSWTEPTMEEIYARWRMGEEINALKIESKENLDVMIMLRSKIWLLENHKHQFWTGKVK